MVCNETKSLSRSNYDQPGQASRGIRSPPQGRHCDYWYRSYLHRHQSPGPQAAQRLPEGDRPVRRILQFGYGVSSRKESP